MVFRALGEAYTIIRKNTLYDLKSPFKLICEFLMPLIVCFMIYLIKTYQKSTQPLKIVISKLLEMLLPIYLGNLASSAIRKFSIYFVNEREEHFRTYQIVLGMSKSGYILGNVLYMYCYTSMILTPVFFTFMWFDFNLTYVYYFACFVTSNCNLTLLMISFFKDSKIAAEVISMMSFISLFAYFYIKIDSPTFFDMVLMMFPQASFSLSVMNDKHLPSSMLVITAKLCFVLYLWKQHGVHPLSCCKGQQNEEQLTEELEMEMLEGSAVVQEQQIINKGRLCQLRGICKQYGSQKALDNISLNIYEGEILALLGRNGAGKTTLIDILTKMEDPTTGSVQMKKSIEMGVCYQSEILYEEMTVEQTIDFYIRVKNADDSEMDRVLGQVELLAEKQKKAKDLSGGMKRRLSIAISIIGDPKFVILDEPTSGLDPHLRRSIWDILRKLKNQGKTLLLTTHHLDEAEALASRVVIIEKGVFLVIGSPQFIKKKFGIGYNLTVYGQQQEESRKIIEKHVKLEEEKMNEETAKYVLRIKDEHIFSTLLRELETLPNTQVSLQLNSLQQAFLAILNNPEIRGNANTVSLNLGNDFSQQFEQPQQLSAMLLKNLYMIKNNPFRSITLYFLNILSVALGILFSNFMSNIATQEDSNQESQKIQMRKMMMIQGYYFSIGIYLTIAVYEKQKKILDVLRVRGLQWYNYWLANFIVDYSFFIVNLGCMYALLSDIVDIQYMLLFGPALIFYSYASSYLFQKSDRAITLFPIMNFAAGFFIPLVQFIKVQKVKNLILWLLDNLYPLYTFQQKYSPTATGQVTYVQQHVTQIVFYIALIAGIELSVFKRLFRAKEDRVVIPRVQLEYVTKRYGEEEALRNVSFSVEDSEILGLLGPNGAGKSTTFKLLTGQEYQTAGEVFLNYRLHQTYQRTFEATGICYQEDTLWEKLSARQILGVFGKLVGIANIPQTSNNLFEQLQMEHFDKNFENLSGGNKRKCCMAVCLIGQPKSKYLDECSTGLDPMSRRSMVKALSLQKDSTVVFTTHSMNEAQAICTKIIILMKGQIKEWMTLKQLKDKHYPCYFVDLFGDTQSIANQLKDKLSAYTTVSVDKDENKIKLEVPKENTRLSALFESVRRMKEGGIIRDFSVYEPNLQDIYLKIIQ